MAVITTEVSRQEDADQLQIVSGVATIASSDSVLLDGIGGGWRDFYVYVRMFDGSGDQVVGGAGTFTVDYQGPLNDTGVAATFEDPSSASIDATAPVAVTFTAPAAAIQVVEANVTTAVTWQVVVVAFR